MNQLIFITLLCFQSPHPLSQHAQSDTGVFSKALWFLQAFGDVDCSSVKNDRQIKSRLAKAFATDRELSLDEITGLIKPDVFEKFAGSDQRLSVEELSAALELQTPSSRQLLLPELRSHAQWLTTSFDMIDPEHFQSMDQLAHWISDNAHKEAGLEVLVTCTGNSRRSILCTMMGNLAAAYYGFDNVRFHSGGTIPTAFNPRTVATLKEIGFQIDPTGAESERGQPQVPNPVYQVKWGHGLEALEFSKSYQHKNNPKSGFAAIMVCAEADAECPTVEGAAIRISMTFLDPKVYDDGAFESRKYAERRDDIGRTLLAVMANARRKVQEQKSED